MLKPLSQKKVNRALDKYRAVRTLEVPNRKELEALLRGKQSMAKRIVVRSGKSFKGLQLDELAYAWTERKVTFVMTVGAERYMADRTPHQLESEFPEIDFFRANRQFLVGLRSVASFKSYEKGKLLLELKPPAGKEVVVSQERAAEFKVWFVGDL